MKNVMHILWDGDLGGVQRYVKKVISSSTWDENFHHTIFLCTEEGSMINTKSMDGIDIISCHCKSATNLINFNRRLNQAIEEWGIDILHCHCDSLLFLSQIRLFKKCQLVYTEHGDTQVRKSRQTMRDVLWKVNGNQWDHIILNSNFTKQKFLDQFTHLTNASKLIPNPLLDKLSGRRPRKMSEPFKFGVMGRLESVKGVNLFIMAAANLSKISPEVEFHVYGEGSQQKYLEQLAQMHKIPNIVFHGYTVTPIKSMTNLDCLVVPSIEESFGLSALEALSVGTPVIAFQETGIADFLKHNQHGYLAQKGSIESLTKYMKLMMSDDQNWLKFSQSGIEMVNQKYSLDKHINELSKLYSVNSTAHKNT